MKKEITIVLFDLDNTLYKHDTEGQWLKHLIELGVLKKKITEKSNILMKSMLKADSKLINISNMFYTH